MYAKWNDYIQNKYLHKNFIFIFNSFITIFLIKLERYLIKIAEVLILKVLCKDFKI